MQKGEKQTIFLCEQQTSQFSTGLILCRPPGVWIKNVHTSIYFYKKKHCALSPKSQSILFKKKIKIKGQIFL